MRPESADRCVLDPARLRQDVFANLRGLSASASTVRHLAGAGAVCLRSLARLHVVPDSADEPRFDMKLLFEALADGALPAVRVPEFDQGELESGEDIGWCVRELARVCPAVDEWDGSVLDYWKPQENELGKILAAFPSLTRMRLAHGPTARTDAETYIRTLAAHCRSLHLVTITSRTRAPDSCFRIVRDAEGVAVEPLSA